MRRLVFNVISQVRFTIIIEMMLTIVISKTDLMAGFKND